MLLRKLRWIISHIVQHLWRNVFPISRHKEHFFYYIVLILFSWHCGCVLLKSNHRKYGNVLQWLHFKNQTFAWQYKVLTRWSLMNIYSALSIYRGHFCSFISRKTPHSSPVKARYRVSFVSANGKKFHHCNCCAVCMIASYITAIYRASIEFLNFSALLNTEYQIIIVSSALTQSDLI